MPAKILLRHNGAENTEKRKMNGNEKKRAKLHRINEISALCSANYNQPWKSLTQGICVLTLSLVTIYGTSHFTEHKYGFVIKRRELTARLSDSIMYNSQEQIFY